MLNKEKAVYRNDQEYAQTDSGKNKKSFFLKAVLICVGIITVCIISAYAFALFIYESVYPNVMIDGQNVGGLTKEQVAELVQNETGNLFDGKILDVTIDDKKVGINPQDIDAKVNAEKAAEEAYSFGREGSLLNRAADITGALFSKKEIGVKLSVNEAKLKKIIADVASEINREKSEYAYHIEGDYIHIKTGVTGAYVDETYLYDTIVARFETNNLEPLVYETDKDEPVPVDLRPIYENIHVEPKNAVFERQPDGAYGITPHETGLSFDLQTAQRLLDSTQGDEIRIPLITLEPEIDTEKLEAMLFKDELIKKSTRLTNPGLVNRTSNVRLASEFVNGTILGPGDVFSYNDTVGKRTVERGFRDAKIFAQGEIVDGVGGGICQVSSTLYMAALYADLEIVNRVNHSFTVDYTRLGEDATVYWGAIDFKFKNNTPYPIKIKCELVGRDVVVTFYGTKTEEKTVEIEVITTSYIPYQRIEKVDESLAPGARKVDVAGHSGYTVETYRVVKDADGNVIRRVFEAKSRYKKLDEVVLVAPSGEVFNPDEPSPPPEDPIPADPSDPPEEPGTDPTLPPEQPADPADGSPQPSETPDGEMENFEE